MGSFLLYLKKFEEESLTPARYRVVARSIWGAQADVDGDVEAEAAPGLCSAEQRL